MTHLSPDAAPERDPWTLSEGRASAPSDLAQLIADRAGPTRDDVAEGLLWTIEPVLEAPAPASPPRRAAPRLGWLAAGLAVAISVSGALAIAQRRAPVPLALAPSAQAHLPEATRLPDVWHAPSARTETAAPAPESVPLVEPRVSPRARAPQPAATVNAAPSHSWETGGPAPTPIDRDLDALLDAALGDVSADPAHSSERVRLPETPTRRQVSTTLRALEGEVAQCGEGQATVRLAVAGATGRVTSATASGLDPATARCVEDAVSTARFPHFERASFSITFPYAL